MTTTRSRRAMERAKSTYRGIGARMRLIRTILNISEEEAAAAHGVTVKTYRRYEAGAEQRGSDGWLKYCRRFDISLDYYLSGDTHSLGQHLSINRGGKVSILPAITPHERQGLVKFGPTVGRHAKYRISPRIV